MTVQNFIRIVWTVFEKKEKNRKLSGFLAIFGLILAVSHIPAYDFDAIENIRL